MGSVDLTEAYCTETVRQRESVLQPLGWISYSLEGRWDGVGRVERLLEKQLGVFVAIGGFWGNSRDV